VGRFHVKAVGHGLAILRDRELRFKVRLVASPLEREAVKFGTLDVDSPRNVMNSETTAGAGKISSS